MNRSERPPSPTTVELTAVQFIAYSESGSPLFRFHLSDRGRISLRQFSTGREGTWVHLTIADAHLTSAYIGPPMDLQEFTTTVSQPALASLLHAVEKRLRPVPCLVVEVANWEGNA